MRAGFAWACEYGRMPVVSFLLDRGMPVDAADRHDGQTGLHGAALGGHADIVSLLLARKAPVNAVEKTFNGTPLTWALHGWSCTAGTGREKYYDVVARLVRAGATVKPEWLETRDPLTPFDQALRDDSAMRRALAGGMLSDGTDETTGR
jgi:ankyrin repeat protein